MFLPKKKIICFNHEMSVAFPYWGIYLATLKQEIKTKRKMLRSIPYAQWEI